jgi:hypothetical protein|tara:strand:+ start:207 stop:374 length:168 start_codon:yes stop_codon:yes gene_type:complete
MFAQDCVVVTRNWEFHNSLEDCLDVSVDKARILLKEPTVFHVKPLCQKIKLEQET